MNHTGIKLSYHVISSTIIHIYFSLLWDYLENMPFYAKLWHMNL